jgi:hypothetical protein
VHAPIFDCMRARSGSKLTPIRPWPILIKLEN